MAAKNKKPVKEKKPTDKLADKTAMTKFLQGIFGDAQKKILKRMWKRAQEINGLEEKYEKMSDKELAGQTAVLKDKLDKMLKKSIAESAKAKVSKKKAKKAAKKEDAE